MVLYDGPENESIKGNPNADLLTSPARRHCVYNLISGRPLHGLTSVFLMLYSYKVYFL